MSEMDDIFRDVPRLREGPPSPLLEKEEEEKDPFEGVPRTPPRDPSTEFPRDESLEQGTDPDIWRRMGKMFKDPQKEGADNVLSIVDAAMNNISPAQAKRLRGEIDKGTKINPARAKLRGDMKTIVDQNLQTGYAQVNLGLWASKALMGDDSPEVWDAIKKTQAAIPTEEEKPYPESTAQEFAGSAAEMFPFLAESGKQGMWRGLLLAGGTWMMGAATGTSAITYPLMPKMFAVGQTSGSLEFVGKVEGGLAYLDLMEYEDPKTGEKINPQVARAAAAGVGVINGLIELAQLKTLVEAFPGGKKFLRGQINETIKEVVETRALHNILAGAAKDYGSLIVKETTQELAQESVNITADILAKKLTNALEGTDLSAPEAEEIVGRLKETMVKSGQAFTVIGALGPTMSAAQAVREQKKADTATQGRQERTLKIARASILDKVRARREEAEAAEEVPTSEIEVAINTMEVDTGEMAQVTMTAEEAIAENDKRQDTYSKIMECMTQ